LPNIMGGAGNGVGWEAGRQGGSVGGRGEGGARTHVRSVAVSHVNIGETLRVMGKYEEGEVRWED
jgi:hypothetical protein